MTDNNPLGPDHLYHPVRLRALSLLQFAEVCENKPEDDESIDALRDEMERRLNPRAGVWSVDNAFWLMVEVEKLKAKLSSVQDALDDD